MSSERTFFQELLANQIWQCLNFGVKILHFLILTPWMLHEWDEESFGLFALCTSVLTLLSLPDFGIRMSTRLGICEQLKEGSAQGVSQFFTQGIASFGLMCLSISLLAIVGGLLGLWSSLLNLAPEGDLLLPVSIVLALSYMLAVLFIEVLPAEGRISQTRLINTAAFLLSFGLIVIILIVGGTVLHATIAYFLSFTLCYGIGFFAYGLHKRKLFQAWREVKFMAIVSTFQNSFWFYLTTIAYTLKGHFLVFLVSALSGPELAGSFYILLRVGELIYVLGANATEPLFVELASKADSSSRFRSFKQGLGFLLALVMPGVIIASLLLPTLLEFWLGVDKRPSYITSLAVGLFGLTTSITRTLVAGCQGMGHMKSTAYLSLLDAFITIPLILFFFSSNLVTGTFIASVIGSFCMLPLSSKIAQGLKHSLIETWISPLMPLIPSMIIGGLLCATAAWLGTLWGCILAIFIMGLMTLLDVYRIHKAP